MKVVTINGKYIIGRVYIMERYTKICLLVKQIQLLEEQ